MSKFVHSLFIVVVVFMAAYPFVGNEKDVLTEFEETTPTTETLVESTSKWAIEPEDYIFWLPKTTG